VGFQSNQRIKDFLFLHVNENGMAFFTTRIPLLKIFFNSSMEFFYFLFILGFRTSRSPARPAGFYNTERPAFHFLVLAKFTLLDRKEKVSKKRIIKSSFFNPGSFYISFGLLPNNDLKWVFFLLRERVCTQHSGRTTPLIITLQS